MGSTSAFQFGYGGMGQLLDERRQHKWALQDEYRQNRFNEFNAQQAGIQQRIADLNTKDPDYEKNKKKLEDELADTMQQKYQLFNPKYDPFKTATPGEPGAFVRGFDRLERWITHRGQPPKAPLAQGSLYADPENAPLTETAFGSPDQLAKATGEEVLQLPGGRYGNYAPQVYGPSTGTTKAATAPSGTVVPKQGEVPAELFSSRTGVAGGNTEEIIKSAIMQYPNVPPELVRLVIDQESHFDAKAVGPRTKSGEQAKGIMQLMPATVQKYRVLDVFDPVENINAGVHYLSDLLYENNGDVAKALAGYYGRGEPLPGQPTTAQYVENILKKLPAGGGPRVNVGAKGTAPAVPTAPAAPAAPATPAGPAPEATWFKSNWDLAETRKQLGPHPEAPGQPPPTSETMAVPPSHIKGLLWSGNIRIWGEKNRPSVKNLDRSTSSEYSISFRADGDEWKNTPFYNREVLVPTVVTSIDPATGVPVTHFLTPDGRMPPKGHMGPDPDHPGKMKYFPSSEEQAMYKQAEKYFRQTGQYLGVFDNAENATAYAETLHSRNERGRPAPALYQTPKELRAELERNRWLHEADLAIAGGPQTPEEKAQAAVAEKTAEVQGIFDILSKLPGLEMTDEEKRIAKRDLLYAALGITKGQASKYAPQIVTTGPDAEGKYHYWRYPLDPSEEAIEVSFGGQQIAPKTTGRGGGSDFWKTVTARYGPNPTAEQIEAMRQEWIKLGAKGSESFTRVDAAGNTQTIRVPTFTSDQEIPPGLIPPDTGGAAPATGQPSTTPASGTGVAGTGGAGTGGAGDGSTAAPAAMPPPISTALPPSINPAVDPAITSPANPADAQAALAEADRLGIGNDVRAVAEYRVPPPQIGSTRGGQKQFMELVQRVNPNYDYTKWEAVQQARRSFTTPGLDAKIMTSLGLSVGHLNKLRRTYSALGNTWSPDINAARNKYRVHTGYGGTTAVDDAANAVSGEMAQVFKNSGATDVEIQSWRKGFDHNMAPNAFAASTDTMTDLMASRMVQEAQTYVNTFGTLRGFPYLSPEVVKILSTFHTKGAKTILEINRQAMLASGKRPPDPNQPTTAPAPRGSSGSVTAIGTKGVVSISQAKRDVPQYKGKTDDEVRELIKSQGYIPVN